MLIQLELRDTTPQSKRLGGKVYMPYCRVVRQSGDGLRLDNIAPLIQKYYHCMTAALLQADPENPDVDKLDKGSFVVIQRNLARFLTPGNGGSE